MSWTSKSGQQRHEPGRFVRPDGKTSLPSWARSRPPADVQELQDYLTAVIQRRSRAPRSPSSFERSKAGPCISWAARPARALRSAYDLSCSRRSLSWAGLRGGRWGQWLRSRRTRGSGQFTKLCRRGPDPGPQARAGGLRGCSTADSSTSRRGPGAWTYKFFRLTVVRPSLGWRATRCQPERVDIIRWKGEKRERIRVDVDKMMRARTRT